MELQVPHELVGPFSTLDVANWAGTGVEKWVCDELTVASGSNAPVGVATETDTALPLGVARPAGVATETDTALALSGVAIRATGVATETDSALALSAVQIRATGVASETDEAFALQGIQISRNQASGGRKITWGDIEEDSVDDAPMVASTALMHALTALVASGALEELT